MKPSSKGVERKITYNNEVYQDAFESVATKKRIIVCRRQKLVEKLEEILPQ